MLKTKNKFVYLRIAIIIFSLLVIIFSSIFPANYAHFICERNNDDDITCQAKRREFYGLLNNSTVKFPLTGIEVKEKTKKIHNNKTNQIFTISFTRTKYIIFIIRKK